MNKVITIIHFLFKKNNIENYDFTIDSFFDNGVAFPKFVKLAFNEDIPNIDLNPDDVNKCKSNNEKAFQFASNKNQDIKDLFPQYPTLQERENLLTLIITKQCNKIDYEGVLNKVNLIVKPELEGISYQAIEDIVNYDCLVYILRVLTNNTIKVMKSQADFDEIVNIFKQAGVPLVLNKDSLSIQNIFVFYTQIEIIFDVFSKKILELFDKNDSNLIYFDYSSLNSRDTENSEQINETKKEAKKETKKETKKKKHDDKPNNVVKRNKIEIIKKFKDIYKNMSSDSETNLNLQNIFYGDDVDADLYSYLNSNGDFDLTDISKNDEEFNKIIQEMINESDTGNKDKTKKEKDKNMKEKNILENDMIHKIKNIKKSEKKFNYDQFNDRILLKVVNEIGKKENLHFNDILQLFDGSNLPKFVAILLKKDDKNVIADIDEKIKISDEKNYAIIKFLGKKDRIFKILLLDYEDNEYRKRSCAYTFCIAFLNRFFLNKTKEVMLDMASNVISLIKEKIDNFKNDSDFEKNFLSNYQTYQMLIMYTQIAYSIDKKTDKKVNIPMIVDENVLQKDNIIDMNLLYYQLQFIFNTTDEYYYIIENSEKVDEKMRKATVFRDDKTINSTFDDSHIKLKAVIDKPECFKQRYFNETKILYNKLQVNSAKTSKNFESYWNPDDDSLQFEDGILSFQTTEKFTDEWIKDSENYGKSITVNHSVSNRTKLFDKVLENFIFKSKLYKFFSYDEKDREWKSDPKEFKRLDKDFNFNKDLTKVPVVFFFNSYEKDQISIHKKIFKNSDYPYLGEDQIYVYGSIDTSLAYMKYVSDAVKVTDNWPLFLLLHVPETKRNIPNITSVVYNIYYFLSIVSDIEIVILNKDHYMDQIRMIKHINNVKSDFVLENSTNKMNENIFSGIESAVTKPSQFSDDGDDFEKENEEEDEEDKKEENDEEEDEEDKKEENDEDDGPTNDIYSNMKEELFLKSKNIIFLVNNNQIKKDFTYKGDKYINNEFFKFIREQFEIPKDGSIVKLNNSPMNYSIDYINVENSLTYQGFLTSFERYASKCLNKYITAIEQNVRPYIECTKLYTTYIKLKNMPDYSQSLDDLITDRYYEMTESSNESDMFKILSIISGEVRKICPSIDNDFQKKCNEIINKLKKEIISKYKGKCADQINESSKNYASYLGKLIEDDDYWLTKKKDEIKQNYINFMEKEFYDIIKTYYPKSQLFASFEENLKMFQQKINEGNIKIDSMWEQLEKKQYENNSQEIIKLSETLKQSTNYTIRETENIREIRVIVESDNLENEIEQDF